MTQSMAYKKPSTVQAAILQRCPNQLSDLNNKSLQVIAYQAF